jgi:hypothetical protein
VADCGEYSHQAIAYQGLFDLKDMQIVRAEIDSIDDEANTASITLLDDCDFDDWLVTSAVPFFYHCEFSTGTVEDLAKGYKAFTVGDMVFIILLPGRGEDFPSQAYIIGHVDIRGTRECLPREYLYIRFTFTIDEEEFTVVTIYDVTTGATLDLASFEPIDESSPEPPASFPCVQTTAMLSWYAYNFSAAIPRVSAPCIVTVPASGDEWVAGDAPLTTNELTSYTGSISANLCSSITVGNGIHHDLEINDGLVASITEYDAYGYYKDQNDFSSVDIHPTTGDYCGVYAGASTNSEEVIQDYGAGYFDISVDPTIGFSFTPFTIPILRRNEWERTAILSCNGETASVSFIENFDNKYIIDFSNASGGIVEWSLTSDCSATFTIANAPDAGAQITDLSPSSGTCDKTGWAIPNRGIDSLSTTFSTHIFSPWSSLSNETESIKSGEVGVYVLWGAVGLQEWFVTGGSNPYLATIYPMPRVWGGSVMVTNSAADRELRIVFQPFSTVTLIEGNYTIVPPYITVPIAGCFENADVSRSNGLNSTIASIADYIMDDHIAPLPTALDRYNATLEVFLGLQDGPSVTVLKKKVSI